MYRWPKRVVWYLLLVSVLGILIVLNHLSNRTTRNEFLPVLAGRAQLVLLVTETVKKNGLLEQLLPVFEQETGYRVRVDYCAPEDLVAVGTSGEVDVVLAETSADSEALVAAGVVDQPQAIFHDDYVLVGPPSDPCEIRGLPSVVEALQRLAAARVIFTARGDQSVVDCKEKALWQAAGITPQGYWYQITGKGTNPTLALASEREGYSFTDRLSFLTSQASWELEIMVAGDPLLQRPYVLMPVKASPNNDVNQAGVRSLSVFFTEARTRDLIRKYSQEKYGAPVLFPSN